ncbi:hypothetical protein [Kiloniella sp.]|uniref:hypothetical protein n=1 Tax=Kiloniella sp. TaxID=1938587 RepID=UPI003B021A23
MEAKEVSETFFQIQIFIILLSWLAIPIYRIKSNNRYIYFLNCHYRDEYHTNFQLYRSSGILITDDDISTPILKGPNDFKYEAAYDKYAHYKLWNLLTFIIVFVFDFLILIIPKTKLLINLLLP